MPNDVCETIGNSSIQHGPHSDRIYLMKLAEADAAGMPDRLDALAREKGYTKIFVKVPASAAGHFASAGYAQEATIPKFYNGAEDVVFLGKFLDEARAAADNQAELDKVLALAKGKSRPKPAEYTPPPGLQLSPCGPGDAEDMSVVYREVFPTYPFPIHEPRYLRETMASHVDYFGVWRDQMLVALASSEMDLSGANVEMTDFATLPVYRGSGLAVWLLEAMEQAMRKRGMKTAYTLARAVSPGMNITFAKMGYLYSGTLINNTNISGGIESMNVWYKPL